MSGPRLWLRQLVGLLWLGGWCFLLWLVHRPWPELGGLVSEWWRWLERFALGMGPVVGHTVGDLVRGERDGCASWSRLRWAVYPVGISAAVALVGFRAAQRDPAIGVVVVGFVAYLAGLLTSGLGVGAYCRGEERETDDRPAGAG